MTAGEVVGLSMTVALLAFFSGVLVMASRDRGQSTTHRELESKRRKLANFLSARRAATRASMTFVAAFRGLTGENEISPRNRLRVKEAHASRRRLHDALDKLNHAEAELIVRFPDWNAVGEGGRIVEPDILKTAIEGSEQDVAVLSRLLHDGDKQASLAVREYARSLSPTMNGQASQDIAEAIRSISKRFRR